MFISFVQIQTPPTQLFNRFVTRLC
jgi:hypothetical protein